MKTLQTLFMVLLLGSALQSQTAWASWNIYRDSTGSGADPVDGGFLCPDDTVWLIVDTTGMSAAGITGWRWRFIGMFPMVVHCEGSECPDPLPAPFPPEGLPNKLKVGVRVWPFPTTYTCLLVTYYASGDSLITAKTTQVKGGNAWLSLPFWACEGSSVPVHVNVSGILDSFVVSYTIGSTTYEIRNQTDFTITLPSGDGTLTLTLTWHVCGNSSTGNYSIDYYSSSPPPAPTPIVGVPPGGSACPNAPRRFQVFLLPPGYTSFVWRVNGNSVDPSSTNHPLAYTWLPPGPGDYTVSYDAIYPCGTVSGSTSITISSATPPTINVNVIAFPASSGYCPGYTNLQITAFVSGGGDGLYSIDVGDDGTIEAYSPFYSFTPGAIPPGGLPIRVSFDDGCGNVVSNIYNYVPSSMADPETYTASASIYIPPFAYPRCPGDSITVLLQVPGFPRDSIRNIQWSWDGSTWTPPSNSFTARLATPLTSGPWTLYCQFDAFSPDPCVVAPTSPISTSISADPGYPPPLRQIGSVCLSGGTVRLVPDYAMGIDSIRYVLPDGTIIKRHIRDTLLLNISPGVFSYPIVYQGQTSCGYTEERVYTIIPQQNPPQVSALADPSSVCPGGNVLINANYSWGSYPDSVVAILWNGDRVRMFMHVGSYATTSVTAPTAAGTYPVQVIAYNCAGSDTASVTFQVINGTTAMADFTGPGSACVGDPVIFQRLGTNNGLMHVNWSFGDGSFSTDTAMQVAHIYTRPGTYLVSLSLRSVECGLSRDEHLIRVYDAPPTLSGLSVEPSGLSISYSVSASEYEQIVWDFGDGNTATGVLSGTHTYATSGNYTVTVTATNACGTNESSVTIVITGLALDRSGGWLVYPNPTRQEVFIAHPSYQGKVRVEVYDLMGRLVQAEEILAYPGRMRLNLPNGLYTLRLVSREGVATTKLLVE